MYDNGLQTYNYHRDDPGPSPIEASAEQGIGPIMPFQPAEQSYENIARHYIAGIAAANAEPSLAAGSPSTEDTDLMCISTEAQPLTGTTTVKFYQRYHKIPIYGSLVTVDLDEPSRTLLAIHSAAKTPEGIDWTATIGPQEVVRRIGQYGGDVSQPLANPPRLYYYHDLVAKHWRLVYITEDVPQRASPTTDNADDTPHLMNYVVDAHSGDFVTAVPRTHNVSAPASAPVDGRADGPPRLFTFFDNETDTWRLVYIAAERTGLARPDSPALLVDYVRDAHTDQVISALPRAGSPSVTPHHAEATAPAPGPPLVPRMMEVEVPDGLGRLRHIRYYVDQSGRQRLYDPTYNVETYDFGFRSYQVQRDRLPGDWVVDPPNPWNPTAVSAHANAVAVADYLRTVLQRNGLDNRGSAIVSSINCLRVVLEPPAPQEWANAVWNGHQMLYGQIRVNGSLRSYAVATDVVAHEITHGLTQNTADMEYHDQSGALNESYSDIFGILIANAAQPDRGQWAWTIGGAMGEPLRDLSNPTQVRQPQTDHMDHYAELPNDPANDFGGVHTNSGIHNKAAYNLLTSRTSDGRYLFTPAEGAQLFYLALTQYLSRTSGFLASRVGVETVAKTLFRNDPAPLRTQKLAAVAAAFAAVGITPNPPPQ